MQRPARSPKATSPRLKSRARTCVGGPTSQKRLDKVVSAPTGDVVRPGKLHRLLGEVAVGDDHGAVARVHRPSCHGLLHGRHADVFRPPLCLSCASERGRSLARRASQRRAYASSRLGAFSATRHTSPSAHQALLCRPRVRSARRQRGSSARGRGGRLFEGASCCHRRSGSAAARWRVRVAGSSRARAVRREHVSSRGAAVAPAPTPAGCPRRRSSQ